MSSSWNSLTVLANLGYSDDEELLDVLIQVLDGCESDPDEMLKDPRSKVVVLLRMLERSCDITVHLYCCVLLLHIAKMSDENRLGLAYLGTVRTLYALLEKHLWTDSGWPLNPVQDALYEVVFKVIASISSGSGSCVREMSQENVIWLLVDTLDMDNRRMFSYRSSTILDEIVDGTAVYGRRFKATAIGMAEAYSVTFGDSDDDIIASDVYIVDVVTATGDGSAAEGVTVADQLIERCVSWKYINEKDDDHLESVEAIDTDPRPMTITHCLNSMYFWAVIGKEDQSKLKEIESQLRPVCSKPPAKDRIRGEVVVVARPDQQSYRARVLSITDNGILVLAIDYGSVHLVPADELLSIEDNDLTRLPGLAAICKVKDVVPTPINHTVVELSLLTLCNVCRAISKQVISNKIYNAETVQRLQRLLICGPPRFQVLILKVLTNLAHQARLRVVMLECGALDLTINILVRFFVELNKSDVATDVVCACLSLLVNIMRDYDEARYKFKAYKGVGIVMRLTCTFIPEEVQVLAFKVLYSYHLSSPNPFSASKISELPDTVEQVPKNPSRQLLVPDEVDDLESLMPVSDKTTENDSIMNIKPPEEEGNKKFVYGQRLEHLVTDGNCILSQEHPMKIRRDEFISEACGILNSGRPGGMYYGILSSGIVCGVTMTFRERDLFRVCLVDVYKRFSPKLLNNEIICSFCPVAGQAHKDLVVLEISLKPPTKVTLTSVRYGDGERFFLRKDGRSYVLSLHDIYRETILRKEQQIKRELLRTKQLLVGTLREQKKKAVTVGD